MTLKLENEFVKHYAPTTYLTLKGKERSSLENINEKFKTSSVNLPIISNQQALANRLRFKTHRKIYFHSFILVFDILFLTDAWLFNTQTKTVSKEQPPTQCRAYDAINISKYVNNFLSKNPTTLILSSLVSGLYKETKV